MHYRMLVLLDKKSALTSFDARCKVINDIDQRIIDVAGFCAYDSLTIGGCWTGNLTTWLLDHHKLQLSADEVKSTYGWNVPTSKGGLSNEIALQRKTEASAIFYKYFPNFKGEVPFFRDEFQDLGYEDDACLVENERMYYRWLNDCDGYIWYGNEYDGVRAVNMDGTIITPESVIGKKWLVTTDCHYANPDASMWE